MGLHNKQNMESDHSDAKSKSKCSRTLKDQLQNLVDINTSLVAKLDELIKRAEKNHRDCLIAKTTGVSAAAVGTTMVVGGWIAGLVLAVPTFGLSLTVPAVMTVAGTATAVAGGITTAGTEIANGVITKNLLTELQYIQLAQTKAVNEAEETVTKINNIINELKIRENKDEALIIALLIQCIDSGEIDLDNIDESIQKLQMKLRIAEYSKSSVVVGSVRAAGSVTNAVMVGGSALIDDVSIAVLRGIGIGTSSAILQGVLRGAAAGAGVIFTVVDIVRLVNEYRDVNPLIEELNRIQRQYSNDIDTCQNILLILKYKF